MEEIEDQLAAAHGHEIYLLALERGVGSLFDPELHAWVEAEAPSMEEVPQAVCIAQSVSRGIRVPWPQSKWTGIEPILGASMSQLEEICAREASKARTRGLSSQLPEEER